ncbi:hypothetical protein NDU88_006792 [Pleurodeles waltl]|uniref:Uncharacterized protein n=1 Tax=Pleurodeles waltl TaxID=8319 RepID=A0AAV7TY50_PLEWA|nr:hypothetical protein NDU88_006792 [Pleurodeles waltl]
METSCCRAPPCTISTAAGPRKVGPKFTAAASSGPPALVAFGSRAGTPPQNSVSLAPMSLPPLRPPASVSQARAPAPASAPEARQQPRPQVRLLSSQPGHLLHISWEGASTPSPLCSSVLRSQGWSNVQFRTAAEAAVEGRESLLSPSRGLGQLAVGSSPQDLQRMGNTRGPAGRCF